jgi:hypothetical protein
MNQEDPILDYPQDVDLAAGSQPPPAPARKTPLKSSFLNEGNRERVRVVWAYVLWFVLGVLGAHKFYLGKAKAGWVYCSLALLGAGGALVPFPASLGLGLSGVCVALLGLFLLIDLFTLPRQVRKQRAHKAPAEPRWQGSRPDESLD